MAKRKTSVIIKEVAAKLLSLIDQKAEITLGVAEREGRKFIQVNLQAEDANLLIGERGANLAALQHLLKLLLKREFEKTVPIILDIDGYRERRESYLMSLARRVARQAFDRNAEEVLEPMPNYERRVIHVALQESKLVRTESRGERDDRRVVIIPIAGAGAGAKGASSKIKSGAVDVELLEDIGMIDDPTKDLDL